MSLQGSLRHASDYLCCSFRPDFGTESASKHASPPLRCGLFKCSRKTPQRGYTRDSLMHPLQLMVTTSFLLSEPRRKAKQPQLHPIIQYIPPIIHLLQLIQMRQPRQHNLFTRLLDLSRQKHLI